MLVNILEKYQIPQALKNTRLANLLKWGSKGHYSDPAILQGIGLFGILFAINLLIFNGPMAWVSSVVSTAMLLGIGYTVLNKKVALKPNSVCANKIKSFYNMLDESNIYESNKGSQGYYFYFEKQKKWLFVFVSYINNKWVIDTASEKKLNIPDLSLFFHGIYKGKPINKMQLNDEMVYMDSSKNTGMLKEIRTYHELNQLKEQHATDTVEQDINVLIPSCSEQINTLMNQLLVSQLSVEDVKSINTLIAEYNKETVFVRQLELHHSIENILTLIIEQQVHSDVSVRHVKYLENKYRKEAIHG